jgi:TonB family protein
MNSMSPWLPIVLAAIALSSRAWAQTPSAQTGERSADFRRYITSRYDAEYPREARERGLAGVGSALLKIDPASGLVKSVTITKSTGHEILDKAAIRAYRRWVFIPHTISEAEVPIIFTRLGSIDPSLETYTAGIAVKRPPLHYPLRAMELDIEGKGVAVLDVDERTGMVTSVRIAESTGHKMLDDAAADTFRQWSFRVGAVKRIRIPFRYSVSRLR